MAGYSRSLNRFEQNRHELRYNAQGDLTAVVDTTQTFSSERGLFFGYYRVGSSSEPFSAQARSRESEGLLAKVVACSGLGAQREVDFSYETT